MSDQRPLRPPTPRGSNPSGPASSGGRSSNTVWYVVLGALGVIAGLLVTVTGVIGFGDADAAEIVDAPIEAPIFEPSFVEGEDAFFPLNVQLASFEEETGEMPSAAAVETGLYGGTAENTCDPQRLIDFLMANPDKGNAWAQVQGIEFDEIPEYINSLTVRVLAAPATVLNHGFDAETGAPYEVESTFDAGTAVLVDDNGDIRARCYCGNPVKPKPVGHKPPRCLVMPMMVYTVPGGTERRDGVPSDVYLTGRVTTDQAWTEIGWGEGETGWTTSDNLKHTMCIVVLPLPTPIVDPTPFPTPEPTPIVDPTPFPTPHPTPQPTPTPHPTPHPTPFPTPHPTPEPTPFPTPQPTPTPLPQPLQINCFITDTDLVVGEQTEFSAFHVPDSVSVTYAFDHGDGTIDRRNPSFAFYNDPGSYDVYVIATVEGDDRRQFCGTVKVKANAEPLRLACSIDNTRPDVGETITLSGRTIPDNPRARYFFDHGDGYQEEANPSYAVYRAPGNYDVRLTVLADGQEQSLFCGTVRVTSSTPIVCSEDGYAGLLLEQAQALANSRGCAHRIAGEVGDTQYRTDRVNFHMGHGRVNYVTIG